MTLDLEQPVCGPHCIHTLKHYSTARASTQHPRRPVIFRGSSHKRSHVPLLIFKRFSVFFSVHLSPEIKFLLLDPRYFLVILRCLFPPSSPPSLSSDLFVRCWLRRIIIGYELSTLGEGGTADTVEQHRSVVRTLYSFRSIIGARRSDMKRLRGKTKSKLILFTLGKTPSCLENSTFSPSLSYVLPGRISTPAPHRLSSTFVCYGHP